MGVSYSHFGCRGGEVWGQVEFLCLLLAACGVSVGSGGGDSWDAAVSFFPCLVGLCLWGCIWVEVDLEDEGVHLAWVARFGVGCLGGCLAH